MRRILAVVIAGLMAASASAAAPVVDGTLDASYGPAIAVQAAPTGFGDANPPGSLGGSELDAAYATVSGGRLYFMLTGNHEPNFNKLDVFIDSTAGGENTLTSNPQYDFFNGTSWISQNMGGLTFDSTFSADYHLFSRWGSGTGPYEADFVNRSGGGSAMVPGSTGASPNAVGLVATGTIPAGQVGTNASGTALTQNLNFAINDNNAAGVTGSTATAAAALAVTTGMEFSVALADIGNPAVGSTIKIAAMINNGDHNYLSNQILGPLPSGQGNLGGDGGGNFTGNLAGVNFNQYAGSQYFEVRITPEPSSIVLAGIALIGLVAVARRK
jgi:PEP-CTERM motif